MKLPPGGQTSGHGRDAQRRQRGQALAEFAFVIPVFLLMVFGIIDLGRVIWANDAVATAAREGARWASVHGISDVTTAASKDQIRAQALKFAVAAGSNPTVTVCYSAVNLANSTVGCTGNADQSGATNARGNLVTVGITATVPLFTGTFIGLGNYSLTSSATMMINN